MNQTALRITRRALLPAVALVAAWAPASARADEKDTVAEALFRAAQQLLTEGKVHEACEKFAASQRVQHAVGTTLNLAACHEKEGRTATAWSEYADANAEALRGGDSARAAFAQRHHDQLEPLLARVTFQVEGAVDGESLALDGLSLPREAWSTPLPVDPGEHALHATAPGRRPYDGKVVVAATRGAPASVQSVSVPALAEGDGTSTPTPPPSSSSAVPQVTIPSNPSPRRPQAARGPSAWSSASAASWPPA